MSRDGPLAVLSYARADTPFVRELAWRLRGRGVRTWIDVEDVPVGETWQAAIHAAMIRADAFVPCISALSLRSAWAKLELESALALGMRVAPVVLDAAMRLPASLAGLPRIDAAGVSAERVAARLAWQFREAKPENGTASRARTGDPWFHKPVL